MLLTPLRRSALLRRRYPPLSVASLFKLIHAPPLPTSELDLSNPTFMIWGSNTGVGKTLVSAGISASVLSSPEPSHCLYVKPVQTGFPRDSDSRFVYRKVSDIFRTSKPRAIFASNRVLNVSRQASGLMASCYYEETWVGGDAGAEESCRLICTTLYGWNEAVSPHLAVEREGMEVDDLSLREELRACLRGSIGGELDVGNENAMVLRLVETAGGVASPGPSGSLQCDLYRYFRLPVILVGDGRLGGISATISAYETMKLRGYDIVAIVLEGHSLHNEVSLLSYLRNGVPVLVLPPVPKEPSNNLIDWFCESGKVFSSLQGMMLSYHTKRIQRLHDMRERAGDVFWWPFTQHKLVPEEMVTVIDSRCGENFAIHKVWDKKEMLISQFDACASWWTQGPDAILQIELAREMGYTAARYGHVMFPENVYEPSLQCAELLLRGVGKDWASRAFFSDNGSTAIEIALKMAFRKFLHDHALVDSVNVSCNGALEIRVLALSGSYHGDTLGAMEAQAPTSYTGFLQHPWYSGKGLFLKPPTVCISKERWNLSVPYCFESANFSQADLRFSSYDELLSRARDSSAVARCYSSYITNQLMQFSVLSPRTCIGAMIIEPVIHGASGMHMVDPLFQSMLVGECRKHKIPVIFDEVFSGFWRLGRESAAEILDCLPDIACFGKLMTGGIIPLAATLATEAVFNAFKGDSKLIALLHGHSYSAHAMGCAAAAKSMQWFKDPSTNINIEQGGKLKELWDMKFVHQISSLTAVKRVVALGTLCAIELHAKGSDVGFNPHKQATHMIRDLLRSNFEALYLSWKKIPQYIRDMWFREFQWQPQYNDRIRRNFEHRGSVRMRDMFTGIRKSGERPHWIGERVWGELCAAWDSSEYTKKRAQNKQNRASDCGGIGTSLHTGGARPHTKYKRQLMTILGREPTMSEMHTHTHQRRGNQEYVDARAQHAIEEYNRLREQQSQAFVGEGSSAASSIAPSDFELWTQAVGGKKKGWTYGLGSQGSAFEAQSTFTSPKDYTGRTVQDLMTAQEKMQQQLMQQ